MYTQYIYIYIYIYTPSKLHKELCMMELVDAVKSTILVGNNHGIQVFPPGQVQNHKCHKFPGTHWFWWLHPVCRWYKAEAITWTHNAMCGHTLGLPFQSAYLGVGSTDVNGQQELFEQILWIIWMKIEHMF